MLKVLTKSANVSSNANEIDLSYKFTSRKLIKKSQVIKIIEVIN